MYPVVKSRDNPGMKTNFKTNKKLGFGVLFLIFRLRFDENDKGCKYLDYYFQTFKKPI
jgi:hypothetical protein